MSTEALQVTCNFTPPEVSLGSFRSRTSEKPVTLEEMLQNSAVLQDYRNLGLEDISDNDERLVLITASEILRECVEYKSQVMPWDEKPYGGCSTFTWLMSDIAEEIGMTSRILHCNDHYFNLIFGKSGKAHMINVESRHMWFFDIESRNDVSQSIPADVIATSKDEDFKSAQFAFRSEGLRLYSNAHQETHRKYALPWLQDFLPAATVMNPQYAKAAMFTYHFLEQALSGRDFKEVQAVVAALASANPQAETRPKLNHDSQQLKSCIKVWCENEAISDDEIVEVIEQYVVPLPHTANRDIAAADAYRELGKKRKNGKYIEKALELYEDASRLSHPTRRLARIVSGKKARAEQIAQGLTIDEASLRKPDGSLQSHRPFAQLVSESFR